MRFLQKLLLLAVCAVCFATNLALAQTGAATSAAYTVLSQNKPSGKQTVERLADGKLKVSFSYRDNGRGPDIFEEIAIGKTGQMESFVATGKSTFGAPIDETFKRVDGKATWKSKADAGEQSGVASALYVPVESSIEVFAITARALLRAPGNKLAALPGGQLSIAKIRETSVSAGPPAGSPVSSQKATVTLYSVAGLSLEPSYIWLRSDPKAGNDGNAFFAIVSPGFAVIQAGWEANTDALLKIQQESDVLQLKNLADKLVRRVEGLTVIKNVRWFDSEKAKMNEPADVYVFRGKIASIFPANSPLRGDGANETADATVIDGTGKTLLPGLFDMHGHTSAWDGPLQIAGGITTLRDMGNDNKNLNEVITRIDAGQSIGPHVVPTGFIEGDSPFSANLGFVVKDLQAAKDAVDWYAQRGYRQVKLYNSMRPEWIAPLAEYAHARGMRVSGHIPAFMRAEEAVRAGFDEIQHINQVMLNFLVKKDDDTRTLLRFYLVGDNANQIDLESQKVKDFIKLLREKNTAIDPTLTAFEAMFNQRQGQANPSYRFVANNVPPTLRRGWLTNSMDVNDKNAEPFRVSYERLLGLVKRMFDAGVPILAGSDDIAGFTIHRELELYVAAGISPADALKIATWNGAKYSQVLETSGSITPGKQADLILVEGDPAKNISDIRKISMVMKSGAIYFPSELYEAMGVKRFGEPPKLVTVKAAGRGLR
jgi:Amidohydrolase family